MRAIPKSLLLLTLTLTLTGCIFHEKALPIDNIKLRDVTEPSETVTITPQKNTPTTASIGDIVLTYQNHHRSKEKVVYSEHHYALGTLPQTGWINSYTYKGLDVYTHPQFHKGSIGPALSPNGNVSVFIQVRGAKSGRTWRATPALFFGRITTLLDTWKLRYGGQAKGYYKFEIVDSREDKTLQATQLFEVSEDDFLAGFMVRGVLLKGLKKGQHGTIHYEIVSP